MIEERNTLKRIAQIVRCEPASYADLIEAVFLVVRERDEARAEVARLVAEVARLRGLAGE